MLFSKRSILFPPNRKQHYIPQYLLKNFCNDGKQIINVFDIENESIFKSSIRRIGQKNYFYSKNPIVEKYLSFLDAEQSKVVNYIINNHGFPIKGDEIEEDMFRLLQFICLQNLRTPYALGEINSSFESYVKFILKMDKRKYNIEDDEIKNLKVAAHGPFLIQLIQSEIDPLLIMDLEFRILFNETDCDYIISDNPVCLYNRMFWKKMASTGLASAGLMIFIPLSPKLMLFLYDYNCYKIRNSFTKIKNKNTIEDINKLQYLNSKQFLYFMNPKFQSKIQQIHQELKDKKFETRKITTELNLIEPKDVEGKAMFSSSWGLPYKLNLEFVTIKAKSKIWPDNTIYRHSSPIRKINKHNLEMWKEETEEIEKLISERRAKFGY